MPVFLMVAGVAFARDAAFEKAPYMNPSLPTDARLDDLVSRMTVEEKAAVLSTTCGFTMYEIADGKVKPTAKFAEICRKYPGCGLGSLFRADWYSGRNWETGIRPEMLVETYNAMQRFSVENTRLGIPLQLGGAQMLGETTIPSGPGIASTFDVELAREAARMNIRERRTFSRTSYVGFPQVTLALDPRWSRVEQTYGEDPFLAAEMAYARCAGARDLGGGSVIESFICHGSSEGGLMSSPSHAGDNEIFNLHMRPFEYAIKGGCSQIMTCYNLVDHVPGILRGDLINGFVRGKLGYTGTFIGDAGAIRQLISQGFARDIGEAAALAIKNGNDLCCWEAENYLRGISSAVVRGLLTDEELNRSVRRVLRPRFEMGLFEHPYVDPEEWAAKYGRPEDVIGCRAHREIVLKMARELMTLLKNDAETLPVSAQTVRRVAVIGPNADSPHNQLGDYTAPQRVGQTITPYLGFKALGEKLGFETKYARGCRIRSLRKDGFAEALALAKESDLVVFCAGSSSVPNIPLAQNDAGTALADGTDEDTEQEKDCGEGFDRAQLKLGGVQLELLKALKATGKKVVTVLITGRPIVLTEVLEQSDALLLAWYPGTEGGTAIAETVFGLNNPSGRLPISFPRHEGALPCCYHGLRGRPNYVDMPGRPLFPFGFGLSYTTYAYDAPTVDGHSVSTRVTNTGKVAGDEVVQLYVHDVQASVAQPRRLLKGFRRVHLEPGETKTVRFELTEKELGFWNRAHEYVVEPGSFELFVGHDSTANTFTRYSPSMYGNGDTIRLPKVESEDDVVYAATVLGYYLTRLPKATFKVAFDAPRRKVRKGVVGPFAEAVADLADQYVPCAVANTSIAKDGRSVEYAENCADTDLRTTPDAVSFVLRPFALPMPVPKDRLAEADRLELGVSLTQMCLGTKTADEACRWDYFIDGEKIGTYPGERVCGGGPDIALAAANPWLADARKVYEAVVAYVRNPTDANWAAIQPLREPKSRRIEIRRRYTRGCFLSSGGDAASPGWSRGICPR